MRIDRSRFLELAVLLAAGGCERSNQPTTVVPVVLPSASAPTPPPSASAATSATPTPPAADARCSNENGDPAPICRRIGPACEGMRDECDSIHEDLKPRVAEAFARCFAEVRRPRCRDKALGACMRRAIEDTCPEPAAIQRCRAIMTKCTAAGKRPKYDEETCAKVLSAVVPGGPGKWDEVDEERLGPSTAEGCSLTYVLPYQPWGPSWR